MSRFSRVYSTDNKLIAPTQHQKGLASAVKPDTHVFRTIQGIDSKRRGCVACHNHPNLSADPFVIPTLGSCLLWCESHNDAQLYGVSTCVSSMLLVE